MTKVNKANTRDVAIYWRDSEAASNSTGNFSTDGANLYSYSLRIGETDDKGNKILLDYTSNTEYGFQSMTTSKHVGYGRRHADIINDGAMLHDFRSNRK